MAVKWEEGVLDWSWSGLKSEFKSEFKGKAKATGRVR